MIYKMSLVCVGIWAICIALSTEAYAAQGWDTIASWYSRSECITKRNPEARTASGEVLDDNAMTCAHPSLPFGTMLKVIHHDKSIIVRVNDRGPGIKGRGVDLTKKGFSSLAPLRVGLIKVKVEKI